MIKYFQCACGWASHTLCIQNVELSGPGTMEISVSNAPSDFGILDRLKMAWAVLTNEPAVISEVVLSGDNMDEFLNYVAKMKEIRDFRRGFITGGVRYFIEGDERTYE